MTTFIPFARHLPRATIKVYLCLSMPLLPVCCLAQSSGAAKSTEIVATVGGQPVTEDDLLPSIASKIISLRNLEYQMKKQALDNLIDQRLLEAEAKRKGIAADKLLEQEVDAKVAEPTDAELNAYYLAQKTELNRPFNEVKAQIEPSLRQAGVQQARQAFYAHLREQAKVVVLLSPPRIEVGFDPTRVRGNPKAKVMIVEFSDFQCPYCYKAVEKIDAILKAFPNDVKLVFKQYPLDSHPQAMISAQAAIAALQQGKFWQLHDVMFKNHNALSRKAILGWAGGLGLDTKRFEADLDSDAVKKLVARDMADGDKAGVEGTPTVYINGKRYNGELALDASRPVIEAELKRVKK